MISPTFFPLRSDYSGSYFKGIHPTVWLKRAHSPDSLWWRKSDWLLSKTRLTIFRIWCFVCFSDIIARFSKVSTRIYPQLDWEILIKTRYSEAVFFLRSDKEEDHLLSALSLIRTPQDRFFSRRGPERVYIRRKRTNGRPRSSLPPFLIIYWWNCPRKAGGRPTHRLFEVNHAAC